MTCVNMKSPAASFLGVVCLSKNYNGMENWTHIGAASFLFIFNVVLDQTSKSEH